MWFEPMFAIHEISINLRAMCSMNFESDSTTSPLAALVEKSSNPGRRDSMPWVSSTVRSWTDHTAPVSHFGIRTTFSSSSFCRWVHRLPSSPVHRLRARLIGTLKMGAGTIEADSLTVLISSALPSTDDITTGPCDADVGNGW